MRTLHEILQAVASKDKAKAKVVASMIANLSPQIQKKLRYLWEFHARPQQLKPPRMVPGTDPEIEWFVWLILAGRGFGKTRAGAEFIRGEVEAAQRAKKPIRCALIAPTAGDARDIMVEGDSGILAVCPDDNKPIYESSKRRLTWRDGSIATLYSAEEPERLRGPQHHVGWADELCAWHDIQGTWDMAMFGMRLIRPGNLGPQICVTTTPKPRPTLVKLYRDPKTVVTTGSTYDNKANLAPTFFEAVVSSYEGTRLGRQEIEGEILLDVEGALWSGGTIEKHRVTPDDVPQLVRLVVAVDPSTSEEEKAESGIIAAGIDARGHVYVLEDQSLQGTPIEWGRRTVATYVRLKADLVVAEVNQGGAMVKATLNSTAPGMFNFKAVHASRGKMVRAEPVSALYERGLVHHVGLHKDLEDQMVSYSPSQSGKILVDRMDALVWAITELAVRDVHSASRRGMFSRK